MPFFIWKVPFFGSSPPPPPLFFACCRPWLQLKKYQLTFTLFNIWTNKLQPEIQMLLFPTSFETQTTSNRNLFLFVLILLKKNTLDSVKQFYRNKDKVLMKKNATWLVMLFVLNVLCCYDYTCVSFWVRHLNGGWPLYNNNNNNLYSSYFANIWYLQNWNLVVVVHVHCCNKKVNMYIVNSSIHSFILI